MSIKNMLELVELLNQLTGKMSNVKYIDWGIGDDGKSIWVDVNHKDEATTCFLFDLENVDCWEA